jgi:hypothetical protein
MVYSVTFFLLNVRFIFTAREHESLRIVAFCLIMGVVALNRLIARDSTGDSWIYAFGLAMVTAVYTLVSTGRVGSFGDSFLNGPIWSLIFNSVTIFGLWWITNRLVHECSVDENKTAGDVGILTGTLRDFRQAIQFEGSEDAATVKRKKRRSRQHELYRTTEIEAFDPTEWKPEEKSENRAEPPTKRLSRRHPGISIFYFAVPSMIIFALGLPVLMRGGTAFVLAGHVYVGLFTVCALSLLMLTSLGGIREYFRARRVHLPAGIGPFWAGLGLLMVVIVAVGAFQLPMPNMPAPAYIEAHEVDPWAFTGQRFELEPFEATAAQQLQQAKVLQRVSSVVFAAIIVFAVFAAIRGIGVVAAAVGQRRDVYPEWVIRLFNWLDGVLARLVTLPEIIPAVRYGYPNRANARSSQYQNPMAGEGGTSGSSDVGRYLATSFDALCALSEDMGTPRGKDETPYEFLRKLPREMKPIREEAAEIVELYVRSAYSPIKPDPKVFDRMRKFWLAYEQIRKRYIR